MSKPFRSRQALWIVLGALVVMSPGLGQDDKKRDTQQMHGLHRDPQAYIAMLEDPERDAYQKPDEVVRALQLRKGESVADIGAGSGYFSFRMASEVGPGGRVYAIDVQPEMVVHLNERIRDSGLSNVVSVLSRPNDPLLADSSVDRFFICDTWHHIPDQTDYLALLRRMLKPGGQIVMIDFKKEELPFGPPTAMKIAREDLIAQMEESGFRVAKEHTFLPYQYFLVFEVR